MKKNKNVTITFQQKLRIKSFCEIAERQAFFVDIEGLNELIEVFGFISTCETSDYLSTGQQLDHMWRFVYDFYRSEIKGVDLTQLRLRKLYMRSKKITRFRLKYVNYYDRDALKTCSKCNEHKLGSEFYWNKTRLQACCKKCSYIIYGRPSKKLEKPQS
jgi:hypothetical protein